MPKKKSLWTRETPCLVCETNMNNYQFMTKSQTVVVDEWMIPHTEAIGGYESFPDELKTTICPKCLTGSNEYSYGVDDYSRFYKSPTKNNQMKEYFERCADARFHLLADEFARFEKESATLDARGNRPKNTRTRATMEKIWQNRDQYGVPFFNLIFNEPRDLVTVLVLFSMDRFYQLLRICFNNDIEPSNWEYKTMQEAVDEKFSAEKLSMKSAEPRFWYLTQNFLQSNYYLDKLIADIYNDGEHPFADLKKEYMEQAYKNLQYCMDNDDLSAVPLETKDGGINLLMAKFHYMFENTEAGDKCLRFAKNYADNRMKRISSSNQQLFVNMTDDLYKEHFAQEAEGAEEGATTEKAG
ncbi:MAG: hypothetical protein GC154_15845 [bacterium]|nr:hypothetical protein [bacterium]